MTESAPKKDNKKKDQKPDEDLVTMALFRASKTVNSKKRLMDM
jgi:hypothetical protein